MNSDNQVLEALPVAIYRTDAQGRLTFYNQSAADLWGESPTLGSPTWATERGIRFFSADGEPFDLNQGPLAQTLRTGEPVRGIAMIVARPDGERIPTMPYPTPLKDESGKVTGAVVMVLDLREQMQARADTERLAAIVSSSDDAIISKTLEGIITSWNVGAERVFGYRAEEMIGQSVLRLIPEELHSEETGIIARLRRGERVDHFETVRLRKGGQRIDLSLTVSPLRDSTGQVIGASKVARDVSERKRAEEVQQLLHNELNHRIKNTLATVQAIASQTLHRAATPSAFVSSFNGRIQALARAHGLLTGGSYQGANITRLVRDQLVLGGGEDARIVCTGPEVTLDAQMALHLALVLHELGANARKYGALSVTSGKVSVDWRLNESAGARSLMLEWRESGGPEVTTPSSRGFGATLIEHSLQAHGGHVLIDYAPTGLRCSITLPLPVKEHPLTGALARTAAAAWTSHTGPSASFAGKRILIVEDEPLIAMVLSDYLKDAGCIPVGPAQTLSKALDLAASESFDAALVDGNLAGSPVDQVAAALALKGAPFAFVTGYGREALPPDFREQVIVEKPFSQEQIVAVLNRLFMNAPAHRDSA